MVSAEVGVTLGWAWGLHWEPLLHNTLLLSQRLERLGFIHDGNGCLLLGPESNISGRLYFSVNASGLSPDCLTIARNVPIGRALFPP